MNFLSKIFLTTWLGIQSLFGINHQPVTEAPVTFGGFNPTGGQTYRLQSSISSTQTTITLSSFKEPVSNIPYTMSYLNSSIIYGTLDPQNSTSKEFISATGITQNSDGTATLTGVTRGLGFSYPYTASTTLQQAHSGQSIFILSNTPQFYGQYAVKSNDEAITGLWNFNSYLPTSSITATTSNQFTTKAYVDSLSNQGAATSTESNGGISELGTLAEQASSFDGGASKPTVLQTKNSTSTCQVVGSYNIVASTTTGKLDKNCFDQTANYSFTGKNDFKNASSSTGISAGYAYFGGTATTSFSNTGVVTLGTTTAGTLRTSSSGTVFASAPIRYNLLDNTDYGVSAGGNSTSTTGILIPANTLSASSTINVKIGVSSCSATVSGTCTTYLRTSTGVQIFGFNISDTNSVTTDAGFVDVVTASNGSATFTSQISSGVGYYVIESTPSSGNLISVENTSAVDFTQDVTLKVVGQTTSGTTYTIQNFSIVVNP